LAQLSRIIVIELLAMMLSKLRIWLGKALELIMEYEFVDKFECWQFSETSRIMVVER